MDGVGGWRSVRMTIHGAIQRRLGTGTKMTVNLPLASYAINWIGMDDSHKKEYKASAGCRVGSNSKVAERWRQRMTIHRSGLERTYDRKTQLRSINQHHPEHWPQHLEWVRQKISLLTIGIGFVTGSNGSGSDLRRPRQIEDCGRLFQLLKVFCSFPGFRPEPEGVFEERPRVGG